MASTYVAVESFLDAIKYYDSGVLYWSAGDGLFVSQYSYEITDEPPTKEEVRERRWALLVEEDDDNGG